MSKNKSKSKSKQNARSAAATLGALGTLGGTFGGTRAQSPTSASPTTTPAPQPARQDPLHGPGLTIVARVLLVHRHHCKQCHAIHETPSSTPRLKVITPTGAFVTLAEDMLTAGLKEAEIPSTAIPNAVEYVDQACDQCQLCFTLTPPEDARKLRLELAMWAFHLSRQVDEFSGMDKQKIDATRRPPVRKGETPPSRSRSSRATRKPVTLEGLFL